MRLKKADTTIQEKYNIRNYNEMYSVLSFS